MLTKGQGVVFNGFAGQLTSGTLESVDSLGVYVLVDGTREHVLWCQISAIYPLAIEGVKVGDRVTVMAFGLGTVKGIVNDFAMVDFAGLGKRMVPVTAITRSR